MTAASASAPRSGLLRLAVLVLATGSYPRRTNSGFGPPTCPAHLRPTGRGQAIAPGCALHTLCFTASAIPPLASTKCLHVQEEAGEGRLAVQLGLAFPGFFSRHQLFGLSEAGPCPGSSAADSCFPPPIYL